LIWLRKKAGHVYGVNKSMKLKYWIIAVLLALPGSFALGQQQQDQVEQVDTTPLTMLGDDYQNSIKLLQNRFRIDYKVDEITMVFFRRYGTAPVVLVQPDGSKIFQSQSLDSRDIEWYDSATFDMIRIKEPTPGPWQAMGQILPESRLMVLSDINLHVDPLPKVLFSGEILKQTATLTNGGETINEPTFRDVVNLDVSFASTNNPNQNNFGAKTETIASFADDGRGMDERPMDGIFTGQFNLTIAHGEWRPIFEVVTPMYTRQQTGEALVLQPNPIKIVIEQDNSDKGDGYHKILIDSDREYVDINSLLLDGKVRFPNGDVQTFSMTEMTDQIRQHQIVNYEYGIYRVKVTAYGTTKDGRDFILDVPEVTFLAEEPVPEQVVDPEAVIDAEAEDLEQTMAANAMQELTPEEPEMETSTLVMLVVGINLLLLIIGGGLLWWINKGGTKKIAKMEDDEELPEAGPAKSSEVIELSMPD